MEGPERPGIDCQVIRPSPEPKLTELHISVIVWSFQADFVSMSRLETKPQATSTHSAEVSGVQE